MALVRVVEGKHSPFKVVRVRQKADCGVLAPGHVVVFEGTVLVRTTSVVVWLVSCWVLLNAPVGGGAGKDGGFLGNEADEFADHRVRGEVVVSSAPKLRESRPVFAREG